MQVLQLFILFNSALYCSGTV